VPLAPVVTSGAAAAAGDSEAMCPDTGGAADAALREWRHCLETGQCVCSVSFETFLKT